MRELGLIFVLLLVFIIPMTIAEHITPTINVEGEIMHIINPYEYVNWKEDLHVCSTTHIHMTTQEQLDNAFMGGLRHFAISNYYPSTPYYYLDKIREQQFKISIEHSIVVNGHLKKGPFDWNKIIMDSSKGWFDELDSEVKKNLPFQLGDYLFKKIPSDIIISPNAEHHAFTNSQSHINSLGSWYSSGTFDQGNKFLLNHHGFSVGVAISWQDAFKSMLEKLQFPEGGGITINHPLWSRLDINQIYEMLDYDNRVLGIEIWNETCEILTKQGFSLEIWDQILSSGRRCYGFSVPDHHDSRQDWKGRNYLLVPEFNERECLKAYQEGKFYCAILGNGLKFDDISFSKGILTVEINKPSLIKIITNKNKIEKFEKVLKYKISLEKKEFVPNYIRIEAEDKTGERIFSQPIILRK